MMTGGVIQLVPATDSVIVAKTSGYNPLTPNKIDLIVKSGLVRVLKSCILWIVEQMKRKIFYIITRNICQLAERLEQ
jgi:hypothetical protein